MGMAAIGVALWKYAMKYSPKNPNFFNRDRFVLSNGHACLFQYTFLHLVGYEQMTFEQLVSYHSERWDSLTPGHPEIEHDGVEVTTGPLGQGIANAVGLAMASRHLGATYNRDGFDMVNNMTWCTIGDACLQEGVAMEAFQLAAHWRLNNLCVLYDNNQITCDGSVDLCCSEDVNAKMRAVGFQVLEVEDGNYDVEAIVKALITARASQDKPTFINIKTTIGEGSRKAGTAGTHGAPLGKDDVEYIKENYGLDKTRTLEINKDVYEFFREAIPRGQQLEKDWNNTLDSYNSAHPELAAEFKKRMAGEMIADWTKLIPPKDDFPTTPTPSRKSAGLVMNPLAEKVKNFMVGTADLTPSVNMAWKNKVDFQNPDLKTACGLNGNYTGRYIHWGIREHAMASMSNGMAAFNKGTILPVTSSFFMFYIYAAPGVRMGALQSLQVIHIATHDSIGTGEDGPTHQPIELAALYRAMPNFLYIRPCDSEEAAGALTAAIGARDTPSMISVARQDTVQYPQHSSREGVQKGAYVFIEEADADVTLLGVGAEMVFAVTARDELARRGIRARVVSFPCQRLFKQQPREYRRAVLGSAPRVIIEAYSVNGWERYADAGYSMHSFGHSLPRNYIYQRFDFTAEKIAQKVAGVVEDARRDGVDSFRGDFRDLNVDYVKDVFHPNA
nr:dihydroxyacetone synthase [Quercus suber]